MNSVSHSPCDARLPCQQARYLHICEQERWEEDDAEYFVHSNSKAAQAGDAKAVHVNAVSAAGAPGSNGAEEDLEVNAATNTNIKVLWQPVTQAWSIYEACALCSFHVVFKIWLVKQVWSCFQATVAVLGWACVPLRPETQP
jgi:hypothetical protein